MSNYFLVLFSSPFFLNCGDFIDMCKAHLQRGCIDEWKLEKTHKIYGAIKAQKFGNDQGRFKTHVTPLLQTQDEGKHLSLPYSPDCLM